MDIKSRLPGCSGQAADAVAALTQVKICQPSIRKCGRHQICREDRKQNRLEKIRITTVIGSTSIEVSTTSCFKVSRKMIRLHRHDSSALREDEAVEFIILAPIFRSESTSSQHWSIRAWLNYLQKRGVLKKKFQCRVDPYSADTILFLRAIQGHFGVKQILILHCRTTCCHRATSPSTCTTLKLPYDMHSISQSGLNPGGNDVKKGSCVFFMAESNVHRSLSSTALRRDEVQDCCVQAHLDNTQKKKVYC